MRSSYPGAIAVVALSLLGFSVPFAKPLTAATTPSIGFEVPRVVDPIHTYGEPGLVVDPTTDQNVAVTGPSGAGTERAIWQSSIDGGHTFRNVSRCPLAEPPVAASCTGLFRQGVVGPLGPPGGSEAELAVDSRGKQYFADLHEETALRVATRTTGADGTENIQEGLVAALHPAGDRQWMAVYDPPPGTLNFSGHTLRKPRVYLVYATLVGLGSHGGNEWTKSTTGAGLLPPYSHANADCSLLRAAVCSPFGAAGYPAIDQATGKVFQAAACGPPQCATSGLYMNIGSPVDDAGNLHFLDYAGAGTDDTKLIRIAQTPAGSPDSLLSVLSMDRARNLYAVWAVDSNSPANRQVFVSAAPPDGPGCTSCWVKWTSPAQVSSPPALVNIFPWIQAGSAGYADAVWYGSDRSADPADKTAHHVWNVYMAQTVFPVDRSGHVTGPPRSTQVRVSPHPVKYNDICVSGFTCLTSLGNRNLDDFLQVRMDSTGAPMVVYADASNGLCEACPGDIELVSHRGAPVVTIARQSSGIGLLGTPVAGPSNVAVAGLSDPAGDARNPLFGNSANNTAGLDIVRTGLRGAGNTLTVVMDIGGKVNDPATAAAHAGCPSCPLQYLTRWQMGNTLYYAMMENDPITGPRYYAGRAAAIDDCSVSGCSPRMLIYPDLVGGISEPGSVTCPPSPGPNAPCTVAINVRLADVGNPTTTSLLEEVGAYTFASTVPQSLITQAQERADDGAREIDGVCCYNFQLSVAAVPTVRGDLAALLSATSDGPSVLAFVPTIRRSLQAEAGARRRYRKGAG